MSERNRLHERLDELPQVEPSAALRRQVFEVPARHPRATVPKWLGFLLGPQGLALALAMLALGALSGWVTTDDLDAVATAEQETEQWEELNELALATDLAEDF
jgi:hypothetical protein